MPISPERWKSLYDRYKEERPRRMLTLDGGGIRGLLTLGILEKVEAMIRQKTGQELHEYFDYVAGTSTGAIIAAGIARGLTTADLIKFYKDSGEQMFKPAALLERYKYSYTADPLQHQLQVAYGSDSTLEPDYMKCLLMVVTKNVTTASPWPLSSNPDAKYNNPTRPDNNARMPLWKLVRASTAAPSYFPAEVMTWDLNNPARSTVFVDGGVTPYNNPAFLLYRMATEPAYRLNWKKGEKNLMIVSLGTGEWETSGASADAPNPNLLALGLSIPGVFMDSMAIDQDINCRVVGRCTYGRPIDRELLDLVPRQIDDTMSYQEALAAPSIPLDQDLGRHFLYARYNADLGRAGLDALGFTDVSPEKIQKMDCTENIDTLLAIGRAASAAVKPEHFGSFL